MELKSTSACSLCQWLDDNTDHPQRHLLIKVILDLSSGNSGNFPIPLFISGVQVESDAVPIAGGHFADVYCGLYQGHEVAVKRFRTFMLEEGTVDKLHKVCISLNNARPQIMIDHVSSVSIGKP
jgi:hypothetical protein